MSFAKNGKNRRYEKLNMSAESKERILNECLKVLDEEFEKETYSAGAAQSDDQSLKREKVDEFTLKRNEKIEKENEYNDWFKKIAVASFSLVATGAIIAGAMNYKKLNKKPDIAKDTTKYETTDRTTELDSTIGETDSETNNKETNNSSNKNNQNNNGGNKGGNDAGNNGKNGTSDNVTDEYADAVTPGEWLDNRLEELSKECYNQDNTLKEGYEKKTLTAADGSTYEIVGKDIIVLSSTQDAGNYDMDVSSDVVYFVCGDNAYQLVVDTAFAREKLGKFKAPHSGYTNDYEYRFKVKSTGVSYYYNSTDDEYYLIDEEQNKTRKVLDKIEIQDAPISGVEYDWVRGSLKFTCEKMGNQQADYDLPGIKCYKMGCFDSEGKLVKEISIVEDKVGGNNYYNVINDIENGYIYFVSDDNKLYRIEDVNFDKISKVYSSSTLNSMKSSYPSIFNDHTCQFDEIAACLGLLRSVISVGDDFKCTLLAEDVRYIKTATNEYLQTSKLDEKIEVISSSGKATVVVEDENVTYK